MTSKGPSSGGGSPVVPSPVDPVVSAVVSPVLPVPPVLVPLEPSPLESSPLELSPLEPSVTLTAAVVPVPVLVLVASVGSPVPVALSVAPVVVASVLVGTVADPPLELDGPAVLPSVVPVPLELAESVLATDSPQPASMPQPIATNIVRRIARQHRRAARACQREPVGRARAPRARPRPRPRCAKQRPCA
jgi:hypothetical protein